MCGKKLDPKEFNLHKGKYVEDIGLKDKREIKVNFEKLTKVFNQEIDKNTIKFSKNVRKLCKLPYPDHPNGCPNYNVNEHCPPKSKYRIDILKKYNKFILIIGKFNFKTYKELRKIENPKLKSDRQISNLLYWQDSVKSIMKEYIIDKNLLYDEIFGSGSGFWDNPSMESVGINVFLTLKRNGIKYEIKPKNTITMVALLCLKISKGISEFLKKAIKVYDEKMELNGKDSEIIVKYSPNMISR